MKAIHYINQFFGQIGGEDAADSMPVVHSGIVGCSNILNSLMPHITVTKTIVCGDNYITNNSIKALDSIFEQLDKEEFQFFFAGPAFLAGRYGVGCGIICKAVADRYNVPVITSMHEENPGVDLYKRYCYVFRGGRKASFIKEDISKMAIFAEKIASGKELLPAAKEGYFPRGIRREILVDKIAADRVMVMLLKKIKGETFETELPIPTIEKIPPATALKSLKEATIALVSSSGIVPVDNPDRIQSASAQKWGKYEIAGMDSLPKNKFKTIHAGFDPAALCEIPDRGVPLDAMRAYEQEGKFKKLFDHYFVTVGTGTTQNFAAKFGREIATELKQANVDAVVLTAT